MKIRKIVINIAQYVYICNQMKYNSFFKRQENQFLKTSTDLERKYLLFIYRSAMRYNLVENVYLSPDRNKFWANFGEFFLEFRAETKRTQMKF